MRKYNLIRKDDKYYLKEITGKIPRREDFETMEQYLAYGDKFSKAWKNELPVSDKLLFRHFQGDVLEEDVDFEVFYETGMESPVAILKNEINGNN